MSWGTEFNTNIYLSRMTFSNLGQLKDEIEETEKNIQRCRESVLMYCSSTPKDIISKDWEDEAISFINNKVNELLNEIEENIILLRNLELYLETDPFNK